MSDVIFVIGHKSPDTDSTVSAVIAANFLNQREKTDVYRPLVTADLNSETAFVFDYFDVSPPTVYLPQDIESVFLVDHNEVAQRMNPTSKVVGIIDHHKINFTGSEPIEIICQPWGSTSTVLFDLYKKHNLQIPVELQGLLLSAILSDTVILRSPTTTAKDKAVVAELAEGLQIDIQILGMAMFQAKAQIGTKTAAEIIHNDFKDFEVGSKKFGIGQIEMPDLVEIEKKVPEIIAEFTTMKSGYHTLMLILTDIIAEGSKIVIVSDEAEKIAHAFNTNVYNGVTAFIPGMMSRKKQVVPVLTDTM